MPWSREIEESHSENCEFGTLPITSCCFQEATVTEIMTEFMKNPNVAFTMEAECPPETLARIKELLKKN